MGVKTDGATFKRYYTDTSPEAWPPETYFDDDLILVNGAEAIDRDLAEVADTDLIEIQAGTVLLCADPEKAVAMTTHFRRWLKKQTTVTLLVEVHRDYVDAMRNAVEAHNGKIIS